jgi:hypothetical protein
MPNSQTGQSASDLIRRAMLTLGVLGSGETPEADEASDALDTLNDMLDAWDSDGLMIYTTRIDDFPITSAKQLYTLGSGGDFNIDRPAVIDRASIVILSNPAQPLEYPIPVYTTQDWQEKVPIKNSPGNIPLLVYDDGGFPLRNLTFWPFASDNTNFRLYSWQRLAKFTDQVTVQSFPPGYSRAIRYNLALELASDFGVQPSATLIAFALQSLAVVKSSNPDDTQLRSDLRGSSYSSRLRSELFNIP